MNSMFKQNMFRMCIIFSSKQSAYQSKALTWPNRAFTILQGDNMILETYQDIW